MGLDGRHKLELGEAAIIMYLGEFDRVERREGWGWHLPEPIEFDVPVRVAEIRSISFGLRDGEKPPMSDDGERIGGDSGEENTYSSYIQTADNNIVSVSYELQYSVDNPYSFVFGMVDPDRILHDATQAAVRQVIGGMSVDDVLIFEKQKIEYEARSVLARIIDGYAEVGLRSPGESAGAAVVDRDLADRSPFDIDKISLQTVHPPAPVRGAFEDVKAAQQDEDRSVSRARGDAQEIIERARAEASELAEGSQGFKQARVLESRGEAQRFTALLTEYRQAPDVTRARLYLETLEKILARAEKIVIDPSASGVIPIFAERGRGLAAAAAAGLSSVSAPPPADAATPAATEGGSR